jgi:hypothetical protein
VFDTRWYDQAPDQLVLILNTKVETPASFNLTLMGQGKAAPELAQCDPRFALGRGKPAQLRGVRRPDANYTI